MKLRFGIHAAAVAAARAKLDALCEEPPIGRRLSYVYMDTPDEALAARGVALRFRRRTAIGIATPARPWQRQEIWPAEKAGGALKRLGIPRLKQRLDATFSVNIDRWTWRNGWAAISLDNTCVSTGAAQERFSELRIVCRRKRADAAATFAVELGATHRASMKARERGAALLAPGVSPR